jgi:hypothetical protein
MERSALASGARDDWRRYYDERRRLGLALPSGEARWEFELPGPAQAIVGVRDPRYGPDVVEWVEQEWGRLATGVLVTIRDSEGLARGSWSFREIAPGGGSLDVVEVGPRDIQGSVERPCGACRGAGRLELGGACLACGGTGIVRVATPLDLGPRATITGPEFLHEVYLLFRRDPMAAYAEAIAEGVPFVEQDNARAVAAAEEARRMQAHFESNRPLDPEAANQAIRGLDRLLEATRQALGEPEPGRLAPPFRHVFRRGTTIRTRIPSAVGWARGVKK